MNKKILLSLILSVFFLSIALAADLYNNLNMNRNSIYNISWVNATYFNGSGQYLIGITGTGNTTAQMQIAVNNSGYYNIISAQCFYMNNATDRTSFQLTYNSTYHTYVITNVSSISNNTLWFNGYSTSFFQNGTEQINTTIQMLAAVNTTGWERWFNITSLMSYYLNNVTERGFFTSTFNTSYDAFRTANYSAKTDYVNNATERSTFTSTFNTTYHNFVAANVSNNTAYLEGYLSTFFCPLNSSACGGTGGGVNYWLVSGSWMWNNATAGGQPNINMTTINATTFYGKLAGYVSNATERALYGYNGTYESTFNSSYNSQLGHNTSIEIKAAVNNTGSYDIGINGTQWINSTLGFKLFDNVKIYFGTHNDVFIMYNSTANAGQLG
jgi:hypothetical protein